MIFGDVLQSYDTDERNLTESIQQLRFTVKQLLLVS